MGNKLRVSTSAAERAALGEAGIRVLDGGELELPKGWRSEADDVCGGMNYTLVDSSGMSRFCIGIDGFICAVSPRKYVRASTETRKIGLSAVGDPRDYS